MANVVNKIFTDRMGGRKAAEYIGVKGDLFYDSEVGDLRISDGVTSGGKPIGGGDSTNGIYRGFQAGVNIFRQNGQNYEYDMAQIFIHDANGRVDYINYTRNTNNDDFYVTGLVHEDSNENNTFAANQVVALNVYSSTDGGLTTGALRTFVRQFIDSVLYNDQDEKVTNPQTAKDLFYANIEKLTQALPADALYPAFHFSDTNRMHWPEYNMIHADGSTDNPNYSATVRFYSDPWNEGPYPGYADYSDAFNVQVVGGTGYSVGDKITANGGQMGGIDGVNDVTLTVDSLTSGNVTGLTMTSGGTNFYPNTYNRQTEDLNGGEGSNASIHINTCTQNGEIVSWELRMGGVNYQVGDTLTLNFGGDDATFEVTEVGTDCINDFTIEGVAHLTSPYRAGSSGYWPKFSIEDGLNDQYDYGNYISTNKGTSSYMANIDGLKLTLDYDIHSGSAQLQAGMLVTGRDPANVTNEFQVRLVSQSTDNTNVWYLDDSVGSGYYQVRFDGIDYYNGNVNYDGSFGNGEGSGDYVVVYDQAIFAMMAFNLQGAVNSVYYNGETGVDTNGTKMIEVLLGSADGLGDSKLIPQRLIYDNSYTLQTADIGKHVYNPEQNMTVTIPPDSVANFPVGSAITFVSGGGTIEFHRQNSDTTEVWGAGFNGTSPYWAIPQNSMATLLKVGADKWVVSGAGLYDAD